MRSACCARRTEETTLTAAAALPPSPPAAALPPQAVAPRDKREALVVALMAELAAGPASRWAPYLAALPTTVDLHVPACWSAAERELICGTSCAASLRSGSDELPCGTVGAWREIVRQLAAVSGIIPQGATGRRLHAHATSLVAAYSFTLGDAKYQAMVPFFDALNHTHPELASVRLSHSAERGRLEMVLVRDVAAGQQVWNSYGPLGTSELVRRYGFALPDVNHYDSADIHARDVVSAAEKVMGPAHTAQVMTHSRTLKQLLSRRSVYQLHADGLPPPPLVLSMRLLCSPAQAVMRAGVCIAHGRPPPRLTTAEAHAVDARVQAALMQLCQAALARRRSIEPEGGAGGERSRLASLVHQAERRCFTALADHLHRDGSRAPCVRVSPGDAARLWRRSMCESARDAAMARRTWPSDLSNPRVARQLCLAGLLQLRAHGCGVECGHHHHHHHHEPLGCHSGCVHRHHDHHHEHAPPG
jgi:hypothetical protein